MKNLILRILTVVLMFVLSACGNTGWAVMEFEGSVSIIDEKKNTALLVTEGTRVRDKNRICTEEASSAWLRFNENMTVLLDELSDMEILSGSRNFSFALKSGMVLARIDQPLSTYETFDIVVNNVTMSVRGTVFSVHIEDTRSVLINVYQGSVAVCESNGGELVSVIKGQALRVDQTTGAPKGQIAPIDFEALPKTIFECVADYMENYAEDYVDDYNEEMANGTNSSTPDKLAAAEQQEDAQLGTPIPSELPASEQQLDVADETRTPASSTAIEQQPDMSGDTSISTTTPNAPIVSFKYMWSGTKFKPYANISWQTDKPVYIIWQFYDEKGNALDASGRFESDSGGIFLTHQLFDISSPIGGNLYPNGCTIKLTPYYIPSQNASGLPMLPIVMELPYFEVSAEQSNGIVNPVISTNIGFYFYHSYENLTETIEGNNLRVKGTLMPREGEGIPLEIDILSKI